MPQLKGYYSNRRGGRESKEALHYLQQKLGGEVSEYPKTRKNLPLRHRQMELFLVGSRGERGSNSEVERQRELGEKGVKKWE